MSAECGNEGGIDRANHEDAKGTEGPQSGSAPDSLRTVLDSLSRESAAFVWLFVALVALWFAWPASHEPPHSAVTHLVRRPLWTERFRDAILVLDTTPVLNAIPTPMSSPAQDPLPVIPGVLALEAFARGRRATVFRGMDEALHCPVVAKVYDAGAQVVTPIEGLVERASRLRHPHILVLYRMLPGPGAATLIWEWAHARPLSEALARRIPLPTQVIARQIVEALAALHDAGLTHRCLHPGNILLGMAHQVYLTDFGVPEPPLAYQDSPGTDTSDMAALGLVLAQLAAGTRLIDDPDQRVVPADIIARARTHSGTSTRLLDAAATCLDQALASSPRTSTPTSKPTPTPHAPDATRPDLRAVLSVLGTLEERPRFITSPGTPRALGHILDAEVALPPRRPRKLLVGAAALLLGLGAMGIWNSANSADDAAVHLPATAPAVEVGIGRVRFTWPPAEGARPSILYASLDGSEPRRRQNGFSTPTAYEINLADLREDATYSITVIAQDGHKSPPISVHVPDASPWDVSLAATPTGLRVGWHQDARWQAEVYYSLAGQRGVKSIQVPPGAEQVVQIPGLRPGAVGGLGIALTDLLGGRSSVDALSLVTALALKSAGSKSAPIDPTALEVVLDSPAIDLARKKSLLTAAFGNPAIAPLLPAGYRPSAVPGSAALAVDALPTGAGSHDASVLSGDGVVGHARFVSDARGVRIAATADRVAHWPISANFPAATSRHVNALWGEFRVQVSPPDAGIEVWLCGQGPLIVPAHKAPGESVWQGRWPPVSLFAGDVGISLAPLDPARPPRSLALEVELRPCPPRRGAILDSCGPAAMEAASDQMPSDVSEEDPSSANH